ncbi:MAG: prepilin-type N-terminal cleavage/methylation domain-containing protein [Phycisphaerales bacterium]|nr:prepilin-type N-terminal cleavage/methylation domain-containing protein [Phycisphaerales bacterium]
MRNKNPQSHGRRFVITGRGFTLAELLVAVAIFVLIIIAVGQVFSAASTISGVGDSTNDLLQDSVAIERQIRDDIDRISHNGFLAIHSVAIPNDINVAITGKLLDPGRPQEAPIRADQLVFFGEGNFPSSTLQLMDDASATQTNPTDLWAAGSAARIYYGHAFQIPSSKDADLPTVSSVQYTYDPNPDAVMTPWMTGDVAQVRTRHSRSGDSNGDIYTFSDAGVADASQPAATDWILSRQAVVLADDDESPPDDDDKTFFQNLFRTAKSIFKDQTVAGITPQVRDGRHDIAATELPEIRALVTEDPQTGRQRFLLDQQQFISDQAVYWPRAERKPPSTSSLDQALSNHVLTGGCSEFIVEWTYDDLAGSAQDENNGSQLYGPRQPADRPIRWFGLSDAQVASLTGIDNLSEQEQRRVFRGVGNYRDLPLEEQAEVLTPETEGVFQKVVYPAEPDFGGFGGQAPYREYWAIFGYNQNGAFDTVGNLRQDFVPWPTALRITMVLNDRQKNLEGGRIFQFIVELPEK